MSAVLTAAIRAQGALPAIDPRQRVEDDERARRARAQSYPQARATLAWCDRHPLDTHGCEPLISAVRAAIACDCYVSRPLVALWAELPASVPSHVDTTGDPG
jgi:hypothetical protein